MTWVPNEGCRMWGRPRKRWTEVFDNLFMDSFGMEKYSWIAVAASREEWKKLETDFVQNQEA